MRSRLAPAATVAALLCVLPYSGPCLARSLVPPLAHGLVTSEGCGAAPASDRSALVPPILFPKEAEAVAIPTDRRSTEGTARVSGTIADAVTGEPLPGAHVLLARGDSRLGTTSGVDGRYAFTGLDAGTYAVEASFIGFAPFRLESLELAEGEDRRLDVRLESAGIQINPITVTASRRAERVLDAPASVTVLEPRQLAARTALTAAEHLKDAPSVDLVTTGLVSSRIVIRGFNDNLASSLLTLVDHRIARAPAVRLTALQLIPVSGGDIDRIEIVSGPASALYGPNAANGVVHVFTHGPFARQGTSISLAGGQQSVMLGSFDHSGVYYGKLGYRLSAQYYSGRDYEFFDRAEVEARSAALAAGARPDTLRVGARDFDVLNLSLNGRLDYRLASDATVIVSAGVTRGANIEITPTGAAQVDGARLSYVQTRLLYRDLFVQGYVNALDSGRSYFLRTGDGFLDRSRLYVLQAQHYLEPGARQRFAYGVDLFHTLPEGEGTVNGRNEDDDQTTEVGAYLQSDTDLSSRFALTVAARVDHHDRLSATTFSPRAALVFKPRPGHNLRVSYNRAFRTPKTNDLFSDVLGLRDVFTLGRMEPVLGFAPETDLRVQGMRDGFHFSTSANGRPRFRSPFAPLIGRGTADFIDLGDPSFVAAMWDVARFATVAGLADNLASSGLIDAASAPAVSAALEQVLPQAVTGVAQQLKKLDLATQEFTTVAGPTDYDPLDITRTESIEIGYKGLLTRGLVVGVDAYWNRVSDFIGPFEVGSPNVFLDPYTLNSALRSSLASALADPANASAAAALAELDRIPLVGNRNGTAAEEVAALISTGVASAIPFGTVSPDEAFDPTAILLMRRNFGDISVYGVDAAFTLYLGRHLRLGGTYAWVSDNYFENVDGVDDISLNAPRHKVGGMIQWELPDGRLETQVRWRVVDGFPVHSDVYVGRVERYGVVDMSMGWRVPIGQGTRLNLTIQNLTDNRHREFVDVAEIGRLTLLRLTHEF